MAISVVFSKSGEEGPYEVGTVKESSERYGTVQPLPGTKDRLLRIITEVSILMKIWLLGFGATLFFLCIVSVKAQSDAAQTQEGLTLRGTIQSINFDEDKSDDFVILELRYELVNTGSTPIILWKTTPVFTGRKLAREQRFAREDIIDTHRGGPSFDTSPEWTQMQKGLDKAYPPADLTHRLMPNDALPFTAKVTLVFPKTPLRGLLYSPSLKEMESIGTIWLKFYYQLWSRNLEPDMARRRQLDFGYMLQRRWRSYGKLWLDDVSSEPIRLDLKKARQAY